MKQFENFISLDPFELRERVNYIIKFLEGISNQEEDEFDYRKYEGFVVKEVKSRLFRKPEVSEIVLTEIDDLKKHFEKEYDEVRKSYFYRETVMEKILTLRSRRKAGLAELKMIQMMLNSCNSDQSTVYLTQSSCITLDHFDHFINKIKEMRNG
jgi:hypothetical protein